MTEDLQNINDKDFDQLDTGQKILWASKQLKVPQTKSKEEALRQVKEKMAYDIGSKETTEEKILQVSTKLQIPYTLSKDAALEQLKLKIATGAYKEVSTKTRKLESLYWLAAAAALMLLLFGIWRIWIYTPVVNVVNVIAEKGEHTEYKLPDGTAVSINADSKISFRKNTFNKNRHLTLQGEAFFEVKKGSSFEVNTNSGNVKVLGTSFNVTAREKSFKVSCLTGKVLVSSGSRKIIITPGESAILTDQVLTKFSDKNINTVASWRVGEFFYERTSLNLIFTEIERQFNVTFVLPKMEQKYFTGSFTNKNLVDALDIVCIPMGLTYEIGRNSKVYIYQKPR